MVQSRNPAAHWLLGLDAVRNPNWGLQPRPVLADNDSERPREAKQPPKLLNGCRNLQAKGASAEVSPGLVSYRHLHFPANGGNAPDLPLACGSPCTGTELSLERGELPSAAQGTIPPCFQIPLYNTHGATLTPAGAVGRANDDILIGVGILLFLWQRGDRQGKGVSESVGDLRRSLSTCRRGLFPVTKHTRVKKSLVLVTAWGVSQG